MLLRSTIIHHGFGLGLHYLALMYETAENPRRSLVDHHAAHRGRTETANQQTTEVQDLATDDLQADIQLLLKEQLITDFIGELKSGKEATVYLARRGDRLLVIKHYRPMFGRHFANSPTYRQGRFMRSRDARAFVKRSKYGRRYAQASWIADEYATLKRLYRRGVPVPEPLCMRGASILMEFIEEVPGSERPAPRLIDVELDQSAARTVHNQIMRAVITMLACNTVHADLSPYNILMPAQDAASPGSSSPSSNDSPTEEVEASTGELTEVGAPGSGERLRRDRAIIIDFPQRVDPRRNRAAGDLLKHDIEQITVFCRRFNPQISDRNLGDRLWHEFMEGRLTN